MEKLYEFQVTMAGYGETADEAWENCLESFVQDPGSTPPFTFIEYTNDDPLAWACFKQDLIEALVEENLR